LQVHTFTCERVDIVHSFSRNTYLEEVTVVRVIKVQHSGSETHN
jgi:hypothetical protein